jgi:hypothetical protein
MDNLKKPVKPLDTACDFAPAHYLTNELKNVNKENTNPFKHKLSRESILEESARLIN